MSLKPTPILPVPLDTAHIAHAAFRKGNLYLKLRDELGTLLQDSGFVSLRQRGLPRLAAVAVSARDRPPVSRAAIGSPGCRSGARIDWKYLLSLELSDAGFDFSMLSEFRAWLAKG